MKRILLGLVLIASISVHAQTFPELRLKNGNVLQNVEIVSYAKSSVMARWDGGRGTINIDELPMDMKQHIEKNRPAPPKPDPLNSALVLPTLSFDCRAGPEKVFRGQVFVVTRGGTNHKLGGIRVCAIPKRCMDDFEKWRATDFHERDAARMRRHDAAYKRGDIDNARADLTASIEEHQQTYDALKLAPFTTTTDADGRFVLTTRIGEPFLIFASARRLVGSRHEFYVWLIPSDEIGQTGEILLNNSNML